MSAAKNWQDPLVNTATARSGRPAAPAPQAVENRYVEQHTQGCRRSPVHGSQFSDTRVVRITKPEIFTTILATTPSSDTRRATIPPNTPHPRRPSRPAPWVHFRPRSQLRLAQPHLHSHCALFRLTSRAPSKSRRESGSFRPTTGDRYTLIPNIRVGYDPGAWCILMTRAFHVGLETIMFWTQNRKLC